MKTLKVISVNAFEKYRVDVCFDDDTKGVLDLADCANQGIFKLWDIDNNFERAFINKESGAITWPGEIDIDTLNCYLQIKGISYQQYKSLPYNQTHDD